MAEEYYHKVCLAGAINVGKTTIFHRAKTGEFKENSEFSIKEDKCRFALDQGDHTTLIELHDTGGLERVHSYLSGQYYRDASGILLVCSTDERSSLHVLDDMMQEAKDTASQNCFFAIVCNKVDSKDADVTSADILSKAEYLSSNITKCHQVYFISAKTGEGFKDMLEEVARNLKHEFNSNSSTTIKLHLGSSNASRKKFLCF